MLLLNICQITQMHLVEVSKFALLVVIIIPLILVLCIQRHEGLIQLYEGRSFILKRIIVSSSSLQWIKKLVAMQLVASVTRRMRLNKLQQCVVWSSEWCIKLPAPEILINSLKSTNICSFWSACVPSEISLRNSVWLSAPTQRKHMNVSARLSLPCIVGVCS